MIKLVVLNRNTNDKKVYQLKQNTIVFGRAANCDVVLESETVSRRHAQLIVHRNLLEIEDLGSGNGTLVNQEKIAAKERVPLKRGDQIRVEEFTIDFESEAAGAPAGEKTDPKFEITDPDILEIKMIKKILGAFDHDKRPGLIVVTTPFQNLRAHVEDEETEFIVGRDVSCQLRIDHATVSRKHARLSKKWGSFVVTDLGSKNGMYVNGEKVEEKSVADGDEIVFGTIKAVFRNPQEFDIDAISKAMAEEQKARDKMQEAAKLEGENQAKTPDAKAKPVAPGPEVKAKEPEAKKSEEKKPAPEAISPDDKKKDGKKPEEKKEDKKDGKKDSKKEDADDILNDIDKSQAKSDAKAEEAAKPKPVAKKAGLSSGEKALLFFGIAVLGLLVAGLYLLLK